MASADSVRFVLPGVDVPNIAVSTPLWLALVTTAVAAVEGAILGRRGTDDGRMDIVGMSVFALLLGLGGGFARDAMLGNTPFVVLRTPWYLLTVLGAVILALLLGHHIPVGGKAFILLDALTLGLYAAIGTQYALDFRVDELGAVLVGCFAALAGGVIVSVLRGRTPPILMPGFPYALLALAGSVLYLALAPVSGAVAALACVGIVIALRFLTLGFGIRTRPVRPLPTGDDARRPPPG